MNKNYKTENVAFYATSSNQARREADKARYLLALIGPEDTVNKIGLGDAISELEAFAAHRGRRKERVIAFEVTLFRK